MSAPKFRDPTLLARLAVVVLGAQALGLGSLIVSIAFRTWITHSDALWALEQNIVTGLEASYGVTAIVFLTWFYRMHKNLAAFGTPSSCGPGFAVVCWFIPVAGLWLPCKATEELWCRSLGERSDENVDALLPRRGVGLVWAWWAFFLARGFTSAAAALFHGAAGPSGDATVHAMVIGANLVTLIAAILAILVVLRITQRQMRTIGRSAPVVF